MQSIANAVSALLVTVFSVLIGPTVVLLLLRRFLPPLGNPLWRGYCRLFAWAVVAPVRLLRLLVREASGRGRR
jgi:hypothetical protein